MLPPHTHTPKNKEKKKRKKIANLHEYDEYLKYLPTSVGLA